MHPSGTAVSTSTANLLWLCERFTRQQIVQALQHFPEPQTALHNGEVSTWLKGGSISPRRKFVDQPHDVVGYFDVEFPSALRHIPDPPLVLFVQPNKAKLATAGKCVAVVGARRCTPYGKSVARELGELLVDHGVAVVSGLALGIDTAAHEGALTSVGGAGAIATIAVLGAGLNNIYPRQNRALAEQIVTRGGCVISEYPADVSPRPHFFLERNRIISGLSIAVVVVEAGRRSGALNTARFAGEQGRDVYAVPGSIRNGLSAGCHGLIRQGAGLLGQLEDLLEELDLVAAPVEPQSATGLSSVANLIYTAVAAQAMSLDELMLEFGVSQENDGMKPSGADQSGITYEILVQTLIELEVLGIVESSSLGYIAVG